MKVRIAFTVDIDSESWEINFGTFREDLREDVKTYTEHLAIQALESQGLLK